MQGLGRATPRVQAEWRMPLGDLQIVLQMPDVFGVPPGVKMMSLRDAEPTAVASATAGGGGGLLGGHPEVIDEASQADQFGIQCGPVGASDGRLPAGELRRCHP